MLSSVIVNYFHLEYVPFHTPAVISMRLSHSGRRSWTVGCVCTPIVVCCVSTEVRGAPTSLCLR